MSVLNEKGIKNSIIFACGNSGYRDYIRFWGLGDKSLWIDEIFSYIFSSQKTFADSLIFMFTDLSPPVYYIVLYFFIKMFGNSELYEASSFLFGIGQ